MSAERLAPAWLAAVRRAPWGEGLDAPRRFSVAVAASATAALAFVMVALLAATPEGYGWDIEAEATVRDAISPTVWAVAGWISLGGKDVIVALLPLATLGLAWARLYWYAALLVVGTVGAQGWNLLLKQLVARERPVTALGEEFAYSLPSGHALAALVFYGALAFVGWRCLRGGWRWAAVVAGGLIVVLVGSSRVAIGYHYPLDVLAGWLAGAAWLAALYAAGMWLTEIRH